MTRFTGSLVCALLAVTLLAGCAMPAPKPAGVYVPPAPTLPPPGTPKLPPVALASRTPVPTETPAATSTPAVAAATAIPSTTATTYDYATLPGWFAYMDFDCKGLCTNVSIIRPDFLQRKVLTNHTRGLVMKLAWAPKGGQIAFTFFTGGEDGHMELRMVSPKSAKEIKLVTLKAGAEFGGFSWSPDGKHIVYSAAEKGKNSQIYRVNVQTKKAQKLSRSADRSETDPVWSPAGNRIAFNANVEGSAPQTGPQNQVFVMKTDGSGAKAIPVSEDNKNWSALKPAWSPDGKEIAFYWLPPVDMHAGAGIQPVRLGVSSGGLWVMNADGEKPSMLLACGSLPEEAPVWAPDGKKVAFACGDKTKSSLAITNLGDSSKYQSEAAEGVDYSISWAPDSKALVYLKKVGDSQRTINLFVLDGNNSFGESANTVFDNVAWSPVAKLP